MTQDKNIPEPQDDDLALPKSLVEALRRADARGGASVPQAQEAFLAKAQFEMAAARGADLAARRRRMRFTLWAAGSLLAAASVALVVSLTLHQEAPLRASTGDIRDAFALARTLRDGAKVSPADDANHDGRVDGADVRTLAMAAVALKGTP